MASSVRASSSGSFASVSSVTITEPTGAAEDDILVCSIGIFASTSGISPPSGWTEVFDQDDSEISGGAWWIKRGASAPALQFSWTGNLGGAWTCVAFQDIDTEVAGTLATGSYASDANTCDPPVTAGSFTQPVAVIGGGLAYNGLSGAAGPSNADQVWAFDAEGICWARVTSGTTFNFNVWTGGSTGQRYTGWAMAFSEPAGSTTPKGPLGHPLHGPLAGPIGP